MNGWAALQWWRYCRDHPDLDPECRVLLAELIARHSANTGLTFASEYVLAVAMTVSPKRVMRHLAHLRDGDHVELRHRHPHRARRPTSTPSPGSSTSLLVVAKRHHDDTTTTITS